VVLVGGLHTGRLITPACQETQGENWEVTQELSVRSGRRMQGLAQRRQRRATVGPRARRRGHLAVWAQPPAPQAKKPAAGIGRAERRAGDATW
jgi:hypothetical protein